MKETVELQEHIMSKRVLENFILTGQIECKWDRGELVWLDDREILGEIFKLPKVNECYKGEGIVNRYDSQCYD